MSSGYEVVSENRVGGREQFPSAWKTIRTTFHDVADLPSERDNYTDSPVHVSHGLEWQIRIYPGGHSESREEDVFVSLFLSCKSCTNTNKIKAKYKIRVPSAGRAVGGEAFRIFSHQENSWGCRYWGYADYAKRKAVLNPSKRYLVDGNLIVEVDIQILLDKPPIWTPSKQTNSVCLDMLALLDAADTDNTDVTFEVGSGDGKELFYAHGAILAARCPKLASLAEGCDPDTPIPAGDVQADVFRMLLRYVYGGEIPAKLTTKSRTKPREPTSSRLRDSPTTDRSLTPDDKDSYEWKYLWPRLKQAGWTRQFGDDLVNWFVRPDRNPASDGMKIGVDYFPSEDDVIEYCRQDDIKDQAKAIIDAANRFECTGLKLTAEAKLATAGITTENAAEIILYADSKTCAMLKEIAMEFFVENAQAVMASEGYEQVAESPAIMREMVAAMASGSKKRPASSDADGERDYKRMRVATLRQKLEADGLRAGFLDGTREMLVSRLEEADAKASAQIEALAQAEAENEDESESESEDQDE